MTRWIFFKHAPKLIIFGTHNLQTFKHNTLISKLLRMQFHWINFILECITESGKITHHTACWHVDCFKLSQLHQQPDNAVLRPDFMRKCCYKLPSIVTFTFIQIFDKNFVFFIEWHQSLHVRLIQHQNSCYFRCPVWKTKSW